MPRLSLLLVFFCLAAACSSTPSAPATGSIGLGADGGDSGTLAGVDAPDSTNSQDAADVAGVDGDAADADVADTALPPDAGADVPCEDAGCGIAPDAGCTVNGCGGEKCDPASGQCVQCLTNGDCAKGEACLAQQCKATAGCDPGDSKCSGNDVLVCNDAGDGWDAEPCYFDEVCIDGGCTYQDCAPGEIDCDGDEVIACNANGTDWLTTEDCAAKGQGCLNGACAAKICTPDDAKCTGSIASVCNDSGTEWDEDDCGQWQEVCNAGECIDMPCTAGKLGCAGTDLVLCDASGLTFTTVAACGAKGEVCDGGACKTKVCDQGDTACNGVLVMDCNAAGTGFEAGEDCSKYGEVCAAGECTEPICTPGAQICQAGELATCAVNGGQWDMQGCPSGEFCSIAACLAPTCTVPTAWANVQKVSELEMAPAGQGCDVDGDGKLDNGFAKLTALVPDQLQDAVDAGDLILLLAPSAWHTDGTVFGIALAGGVLDASNASCDVIDAVDTCKYKVLPDDFDLLAAKGAVCPAKSVLSPASVTSAKLAAGGKSKLTLMISLLPGAPMPLVLTSASLTATVAGPGQWTSSSAGMICGAVTTTDLDAAIDAIPDALLAAYGDKATVKALVGAILTPDIDTDGDGTKDAASIALKFASIPGTITGLAQ